MAQQGAPQRAGVAQWLFYNYPAPAVLHDDQYSGENYRQREYTKRKAAYWVARYREMPPHEQQRILD